MASLSSDGRQALLTPDAAARDIATAQPRRMAALRLDRAVQRDVIRDVSREAMRDVIRDWR